MTRRLPNLFRRKPLVAAFAFAAALAIMAAPAQARVTVPLDQTRPLVTNEQVVSVVLSNPTIADVSVQSPTQLLILGKSFGRTNVLGFNAKNEAILNTEIFVVGGASGGQVTLYRGAAPVSYTCAPVCERTLSPGDDGESFKGLLEQIQNRAALSASAVAE
ncbi:MAG: pilus assembly protein N-terminal domain-containing protein [Pseudomonadota bacterium]